MNTIHGKSACCRTKIYRFGSRRRQCSLCKRTWRVWLKKRGRSRLRLNPRLLERVLLRNRSITELAKLQGLTRQALAYRFQRALQCHLSLPATTVAPPGKLILITDGLWFRFQGCYWVLYLAAFKPCRGNYAIFWDPLLLKGKESFRGWQQMIQTIPDVIKSRIQALVCDNFRGAKLLARTNGWILQLCHFHLIAQLQARRGHWKKRGMSAREIRETMYQLIRTILEVPSGSYLDLAIEKLRAILREPAVPQRHLMLGREFLRNIGHYRAYQQYPKLGLPSTTGSVESMGRILRDLMCRTRSLSTSQSLQLWTTMLIRMRPRITCNGKHFSTN